ncbi:hypothetical protein Fmac_026398 [Flemingia macrophylla]|uniref:Uncharacterized protein n=1 Tax=Flemingia macrophylla TaxID=520843 RepID=A0ABD1LER4_9FABA
MMETTPKDDVGEETVKTTSLGAAHQLLGQQGKILSRSVRNSGRGAQLSDSGDPGGDGKWRRIQS